MENKGIVLGKNILEITWGMSQLIGLKIETETDKFEIPDFEYPNFVRVRKQQILEALRKIEIWEEVRPRKYRYLELPEEE